MLCTVDLTGGDFGTKPDEGSLRYFTSTRQQINTSLVVYLAHAMEYWPLSLYFFSTRPS
jgi:hypothetical protein